MRADRLIATLLLMQTRGRVTAAEVAAELEVSRATARRDLEALAAAGIPVYPQPGRGGGWALVGGARTNLNGLTAEEAQALFLLLGPAATTAPGVRSALRKLMRALPETFRADVEAAADAVVVDPAGWGERHAPTPPLVAQLQQAVVRRRAVRLTYGRNWTDWQVEPWGLVDKDAVWYLIAGTVRGRRTFRVDRIRGAEITDETFERPADFDLSAAWAEVVDEMEQRRAQVTAVVLADPAVVPILRDRHGRNCIAEGTIEDGRFRLRITAHLARSIAEQLAGWGAAVEVVAPEEVREELRALAGELAALYGH
ncbi:WYL domain-containing protein [Nocardia sp. CDC159]|uniref:WYL domain-containing protein n=1 Tax=Nocardia pulmonis TaxID=2951408 RepID=A0A9X2IY89_9NOCA|nr:MULTISPECIES: WYL domain-containing protein [Nocardia]MCM6773666.1 WYL domain-containing protein [Nocardia pulmonis]MCM6786553.1 WYL domain-containing protein [Nocardia sp. CDC159]